VNLGNQGKQRTQTPLFVNRASDDVPRHVSGHVPHVLNHVSEHVFDHMSEHVFDHMSDHEGAAY
jgi:hypothetical protein